MEVLVCTRLVSVLLAICVSSTNSLYVITDPVSQSVITNGSLTLTCPSPNSTETIWLKGPLAGPLTPITGDPRITTNASNLSLTSFHAIEHVGMYHCLINTQSGDSLRSCPANISHAVIHHQFSEEPEDTTVAPGTTALLRCRFTDSNPAATFRWKKDGHPLLVDNERVILSPSGYLYIRDVMEEDQGQYQCLAMNEVTGKTRRSRIITLTVNTSLASPEPQLIVTPNSMVTLAEGASTVLDCATNSPNATISWSHNSGFLPQNSFMLPAGPLVIDNITESSGGSYTCRLHSNTGIFITASFSTIQVASPPRVTITGSETVSENSPLSLVCSVTTTSEDPVTVVWSKGSEVIQSAQHTVMGTIMNTLSLGPAHSNDSGLYQCMAYGPYGCDHAVVTVTYEEALPPPIQVSVNILGGTAVCVVQGDLSLVNFGLWQRNGELLQPINPSSSLGGYYVDNLVLSTPGVYSCVIHLTTGGLVFSDSISYLVPTTTSTTTTTTTTTSTTSSTSLSPSSQAESTTTIVLQATPTEETPPTPIQLSIDLHETGQADCRIQGDFSLVNFGLWRRNGEIVPSMVFTPSGPGVFISTYNLTSPGVYVCEIRLTDYDVISDTIYYNVLPTTTSSHSLQATPTSTVETPPSLSSSSSATLQPSPDLTPPPATPPPVTVSLTSFGSLAVLCFVQGDLQTVSVGVWLRDGILIGYFSVPNTTGSSNTHQVSTGLTDPGTYTCRVQLTSGVTVEASVDYGSETTDETTDETPSPSPTTSDPPPPSLPSSPPPSPPPPSSPVLVSVQKSTENMNCVISGVLTSVTSSRWIVTSDGVVVINSSFVIMDSSKELFFNTFRLSWYGVYTCHVTLSNGESVSHSLEYADPSLPSSSSSSSSPAPSPPPPPQPSTSPRPPSPPPPPRPSVTVTLRYIGDNLLICNVSLPESQVESITIRHDESGRTLSQGTRLHDLLKVTYSVHTSTPGTYICEVRATGNRTFSNSFVINQPTPVITPPTNLIAEWFTGDDGSLGNIRVRWAEPVVSVGVLGYKINWDHPVLITDSGRYQLAKDVFEFTITNLDVYQPYMIKVWAFSIDGDHDDAQIELPPLACPEPCPTPLSPTSLPPSPSPLPLLLDGCSHTSPNTAQLLWKNFQKEEVVLVSYGCGKTLTTNTVDLLVEEEETQLSHLLPNCTYTVKYGLQTCVFTTPPGHIDVQFDVTVVEGKLVIKLWDLPPELNDNDVVVKVEININGEWEEVTGNNNLPSLDNGGGGIQLRFSVGGWSSVSTVSLPSSSTNNATTPTPTSVVTETEQEGVSVEEQVLLYGTVIAVVCLVCVTVVGVLLILKYIQITHRDSDKVTDHRQHQREIPRKMSMERSSLKRPINHSHSHTNGVNGITMTTPGSRSTITRVTNV